MFQAGLLLIIRRYYSVYKAIGLRWLAIGRIGNLPTVSQHIPIALYTE